MGIFPAKVRHYEVDLEIDSFSGIYDKETDRINPHFVEKVLDEYEELHNAARGGPQKRVRDFVKRKLSKGKEGASPEVPPLYKIRVEVPDEHFEDCAVNSYDDIASAMKGYCVEHRETALRKAFIYDKVKDVLVLGFAPALTWGTALLTLLNVIPASKETVGFAALGPDIFLVAAYPFAFAEGQQKKRAEYFSNMAKVDIEFSCAKTAGDGQPRPECAPQEGAYAPVDPFPTS